MHVVTAGDSRFYQGVTMCLHSTMQYANKDYTYVLHVLDGGLSDQQYTDLDVGLTTKYSNVLLERHVFDKDRLSGLRLDPTHTSASTYARLLIPEIISVPKVLYIDADILIGRDVSELLEDGVDSDVLVSAVRDPYLLTLEDDCPWIEKGSEESLYPYFNAGFMVMYLDRWRLEDVGKTLLSCAIRESSRCDYKDQTVLNYVLRGRVKIIDFQWNVDAREVASPDFTASGVNYHFFGYEKPWLTQKVNLAYLYFALRMCEVLPDDGRKMWGFTSRADDSLPQLTTMQLLVSYFKILSYELLGVEQKVQKRRGQVEAHWLGVQQRKDYQRDRRELFQKYAPEFLRSDANSA